ncbi:MAG TPA: type II secretion system F family protein [Tepidisphaeraceae bacterium]|nr:type II secretion system F family protein [Tepidisphaeraceae bacterium]
MAAFAYIAIDSTGRQTSGQVDADSRSNALDQVMALGLSPVDVHEKASAAAVPVLTKAPASVRLSQSVVESFTRELANLLAGGLPLSRALQLLKREVANPAAKFVWGTIHDDVVGGMPLADALAKWPKAFSTVYVAMVRAGEAGGFLELVLQQIAEFRAREQDLKGKVKAAMIYPAVLAVLAVGVVTFLLTFFIPQFKQIFAEQGGTLPLITRIVVGVSQSVTHYGIVLIALIVGGVLAFQRARSNEAGRRAIERFILRLPGVGKVVARFALVRFCRMLGTLVGAGVPLVTSLKVAKEAIGNQTLSDAVVHGIEEVQRGSSLAKALGNSRQLFPAMVVETITVAEETGRLDKELTRLATAFETDLDRQLRILVATAEPVMLFIMAAIIGTVVIAMILPVFNLYNVIH